jgi:hypothetical protein
MPRLQRAAATRLLSIARAWYLYLYLSGLPKALAWPHSRCTAGHSPRAGRAPFVVPGDGRPAVRHPPHCLFSAPPETRARPVPVPRGHRLLATRRLGSSVACDTIPSPSVPLSSFGDTGLLFARLRPPCLIVNVSPASAYRPRCLARLVSVVRPRLALALCRENEHHPLCWCALRLLLITRLVCLTRDAHPRKV